MPPKPDLFYEADVPVESSSAGSIFMHRLIGACEPARWLIVETNLGPARGMPRLAGPVWIHRRRRGLRLISRRGGWLWAVFLAYRSWFFPPAFPCAKPRAVYTVAHGLTWIGVVARAKREGVHCVVHCHDHPGSSFPGGARAWRIVSKLAFKALASADVCLAVSPTGEAWLQEIPAARTDIVYSVWNSDSIPPAPPQRTGPRVLGYAGSITYSGYRSGIIAASHAAASAGWRMVVFPSAPVDEELRAAVAPVVEWRDTVPASELPGLLAATVDAALITTDFDPNYRDWVRVACPAKLADYAYAGVPVIAVVPPWSSLASVGKRYPDLLTVVPVQDVDALQSVLARHETRDAAAAQTSRQVALTVLGLENNARVLRAALGLQ